MKYDIYEIKNRLSKIDLDVLHNIYLYRCLTIRQVYDNFYKENIDSFNNFIDTKLKLFLKYELIEEVIFNKEDNIALFLTKLGIDLVKESFDLPINIYVSKKNDINRGYYRASELKMLPRLIPHQIHLNQFVLDFKRSFDYKGLKMKWKYFGEKYVSQYNMIRPDGLIRLPEIDLFLEMDMNTESKAQLEDKWKHYRSFLSSSEFSCNEKKIIVLFIVANTSNIANRKNIVRKTASEILLDKIDGEFEIIVGTKEELLKKIFNILIPNMLQTNPKIENLKNVLKRHNFNVDEAIKLKTYLNNNEYGYYIRKLDINHKIIKEQGVIQEYLLDYYDGDSLSVINRIAYHSSNSSYFRYYHKRDIKYLVVCQDLKDMYLNIDMFNLNGDDSVYYTTLDRLAKYPFYQAICQFDNFGRLFSFTDNKLHLRNYLD